MATTTTTTTLARAQFRLDVTRPWTRSIKLTADELYALTGDAIADSVELFGGVWYRVTPVAHPVPYVDDSCYCNDRNCGA